MSDDKRDRLRAAIDEVDVATDALRGLSFLCGDIGPGCAGVEDVEPLLRLIYDRLSPAIQVLSEPGNI